MIAGANMGALRQRILELLIQNNLLTPQALEEIKQLQKDTGKKFSSLLLEKTSQKEPLIEFINNNINLPAINASQIEASAEALNIISGETARSYRLLPVGKDDQALTLAIADPLTILDFDEIEELRDWPIKPVVAGESELAALIKQYYPQASSSEASDFQSPSMENILSAQAESSAPLKEEANVSEISQKVQEAPVVKATNFILEKAIDLKASDILIEPLEKVMRIRMRVDGMWRQVENLPLSFHPFIVSRIKVISNLDISEHRLPQDGQFQIKLKGREIEFRISSIASSSGEKVAIRVLDKSLALLDVDKLGLRQEAVDKLKKSALMPHGMILVCGPTGSGKTTTLYAILEHIHTPQKNIVTVEDPVEYQIKGINQVAVNPKTGLIFSRCLRAILRQDPNVIMIGEIRDFETVDIAIKAALTGHLVLSTLHTTTAAGSIVRLLDMGVEPFLINASLIAVVAQRLARRICPHCREKMLNEPYFIGRGCKECLNSGYSGRILVTEILYVDHKIRETIVSEKMEEAKIKTLARAGGMRSLREEAEGFALAGITSWEEVLRVTPAD